MEQRALLICPIHPMRQQLIEAVRRMGTKHVIMSSVKEATKAMKDGNYSVIITGRRLEDGTSDDLLQAAKAPQPGVPVVVVSRTGDWDEYIEAIDRGAFDLLPADSSAKESARIIGNALAPASRSRVAEPAVESRDLRQRK